MLLRLALAFLAAFALCSCTRSSPQDIAERAKNLGVYTQTSDDLSELPTFGVEEHESLGQTVSFKFTGNIPTGNPSAFIVNMPGAIIAESKIFLLADPSAATWPMYFEDPSNPAPIPAAIEPLTPSIYKITPRELPESPAGFLCLLLKMPMGSPDRMYAVRLPHQGEPVADTNPTYSHGVMATAELMVKANPDLDLVESDAEAGTLTIRNRRTGEEVTMSAKDIQEGRVQFK